MMPVTTPATPPGPSRGRISATQQAARRLSAPVKVPLAERAWVVFEDRGLADADGAIQVIEEIRERRAVTKLTLAYNSLGIVGSTKLFQYLCTPEGRAYRIAELRLNSNSIGDEGLAAIIRYLRGNVYLKDLYLQENEFEGNKELGTALGLSVNNSRLSTLNLNTNRNMTSSFFEAFISSLDSTTLRELYISNLGLKPEVSPALIAYLSCPRSRVLQTLKCNANNLGKKAIGDIIWTLNNKNFNLRKVEFYANRLAGSEQQNNQSEWGAERQMLRLAQTRNDLIFSKVISEALGLLRYSRTLLLPASRYLQSEAPQDAPVIIGSATEELSVSELLLGPDDRSKWNASSLRVFMLPVEVLHNILSFLSPTLSPAQCSRIFTYAAQPNTLPPVLPPLWKSSSQRRLESVATRCLPDPASLPFSTGEGNSPSTLGHGSDTGPKEAGIGSEGGVCAAGRCMGASGSVRCERVESRMRWLEEIGCMHFDSRGLNEEDVMRLLRRPNM